MINATLTMPEVTGPVDFNINSIKGLEAAKPDGHLIKFNPPDASNSGDAAFSFILDIPAGRSGLQPQIAVSYSSAGGNGIMGKGFDVNFGSTISIDTRKKLPDYNESDAYLKDGVKLKAAGSSNKEYRLLRRSVKEKIERHNAFSKDDWWEITDTHGTVYRYGYYKAYTDTENNAYAGKKDENGKDKIYTWYLSEVENADGNTILYEYEKDKEYVYPSKITYTGNVKDSKQEKGKYEVIFKYIKDQDERHRQDVRVDARSRFVMECRWLLGSIESGYNGKVTRKYCFSYEEGLSKEKYLTALTVKNGKSENSDSYTYSFAYNELEKIVYDNETVTYKIFDEPEQWLTANSPVNTALDSDGMNKNNVSMSSSSSDGYSVNGGFGVGVGGNTRDARLTGGAGGSKSEGTGYTNSILLDINGDSIPDLVKQNGNSIFIYLCVYDRLAKTFSYRETPAEYDIGTQINLEKSKNSSSTVNMYGGLGSSGGGVGVSYAYTTSNGSTETKTGFADVNGDGRVDIITGSNKYYKNETDGENVKFTLCKIRDYASSRIFKFTPDEIKEYSKKFFVQRPFKAWKVRDDGNVNIKQKIKGNGSLEGKVYIDSSEKPADSEELENLSVKSGQYIYFVPDLKKGEENWNEEFEWNVKIDYKTVRPFKIRDDGLLIAVPKMPELKNKNKEELYFYDKNLDKISNLYQVLKKPRDPSNTSVYEEYYAELKNEYYKEELSEEGVKYILKSNSYIPLKINNISKADDELNKTSFIDRLKEGEKHSVYEILNSYIYDPVSDCFRFNFNGQKVSMDIINSLKRALVEVGFNYQQYIKDLEKNYAEPYICTKSEVQQKYFTYRMQSPENTNKEIFRDDTSGKCVNNVLFINDNILGAKIHSFDLENKSIEADENYTLDTYFSFNDTQYITIKDGKNKYLITYIFKDFTNCLPEISDEEIHRIFENSVTQTQKTDITSLIKECIKENKGDKAETDFFIASCFNDAVNKGYLSVDDKNDLVKILLTEVEDKYTVNTEITAEHKEKISDIEYKYNFYKFITESFNFYKKTENDDIYWKLKDDLTDKDIEDITRICNNLSLGLYKTTSKQIEYLAEGEYELSGDKYALLILNDNKWELKEDEKFERKENDSLVQYSENNLVTEKYFGDYEYSFTVETSGIPETKTVSFPLIATNEDCLYGGENAWLYGIWQGDENENKFSKKTLNTSFDNADSYEEKSEEDYENQVAELGKNNDCDNIEKYNLSYYLPVKCSDVKENKPDEKIINSSSIVGTIDCLEFSSVTDENGSMKVERTKIYSAPFINKDRFVCNRLGGDTYYNIEGIAASSSGFAISKSRNTSKDHSFGPSANIKAVSLSESTDLSEGKAYQEQSLQDVTGDGIPDIIQSKADGKTIIIKKGVIDKHTNELCFIYEDSEKEKNIGGYLSESNNNSTSMQGSVGASSQSLEKAYSAKGNVKNYSMANATGLSKGYGSNKQTAGLIDLNGDGIADYIKEGKYKIGNGREYTDYYAFDGNNYLQKTSFTLKGFDIGADIGNTISDLSNLLNTLKNTASQESNSQNAQKLACTPTFGFGGSVSTSTSSTDQMYLDVNGDGLPDIIKQYIENDELKTVVKFNTGISFTDECEILLPRWKNLNENPITSNIATTVSVKKSAGVSINISVPVPPLMHPVFNFTTSVGGGTNNNSTVNVAEITMTDLNGDGKADQVLQIADGSIWWKKNITGKAGLLKTVYLPQGGKFEIDYEGEYGTTDNPGFKYVMSEVKVSDGTDSILPAVTVKNNNDELEEDVHEVVTKYSYEGAYFDREEKDSYGYNTVITTYPDDTYGITKYSTKTTEYRYNFLGATMSSKVYSSEPKDYKDDEGCMSSSEVDYLEDEEWVLVLNEKSEVYEKNGSSISNMTAYEYDDYGNVTSISQKTSDSNVPEVHAYITYDKSTTEKYIVSNPASIKVFDHKSSPEGGDYIRYRSGTYDSNNGHLMSITQYAQPNENQFKSLTTLFTYDETYGNIKTVTDQSGVTLKYDYDKTVNQFIENVSQVSKYGASYNSSIEYNYETQTKTKETDCNGNSMEYEYDQWQRITSIKTPEDGNGIKAVSYEYYCPDTKVTGTQDGKREEEQHAFWAAVTKNKVNFDSDKVIETIVQIDGLGGVFRTAKTGVKFNPGTKESEKGWNVSGAAVKDVKGRTVKAGQ
ncbi:MAG: hypothetical protein IK024_08050, partial [Treponema sp.]|nr:hypothetical protein [Treponema sp.]